MVHGPLGGNYKILNGVISLPEEKLEKFTGDLELIVSDRTIAVQREIDGPEIDEDCRFPSDFYGNMVVWDNCYEMQKRKLITLDHWCPNIDWEIMGGEFIKMRFSATRKRDYNFGFVSFEGLYDGRCVVFPENTLASSLEDRDFYCEISQKQLNPIIFSIEKKI